MSEKQKILIVDDEPRNQRIVAEALEGLVEFRVATNGEEALGLMEAYRPDLVLLDIMMPGIGGYEVCKTIRSNPSFTLTKVILVSGKAMIEERLKGYEVGADDYMTKPFESEELLAKVKVFLRLNRMEQELEILNRSLDEKVKERTQQLVDAEAKLVTTAKMSALGEMAGGIAHEINTPLGTIGMIAEQIKELVNEETVEREMISEMSEVVGLTVQRISSIIQGLKTFSRDGSRDSFSNTSLKQIIDNTLTLCREKLKNSSVKLILDSIDDDISIQCQPVQISQVLLNLVSNACDAVSRLQEKWIEISTERQGDMIRILVTDSGGGISREIRNKLFEPFFTTKDIGKGTGLGLSIAKGIAEAHQGQLTLDDGCVNTRFVLNLPGIATKI
jgi:C4-dicarboxylate-specific signal transduction histidine kinase